MSEELVKLTTLEGNITEVPVKIISKSVLIKGLIEDSGVDEEIPIPNIKKEVLDKIIEYLKYSDTNPAPEIEKPLKSASLVCLLYRPAPSRAVRPYPCLELSGHQVTSGTEHCKSSLNHKKQNNP